MVAVLFCLFGGLAGWAMRVIRGCWKSSSHLKLPQPFGPVIGGALFPCFRLFLAHASLSDLVSLLFLGCNSHFLMNGRASFAI
jgi:hypothetical protein